MSDFPPTQEQRVIIDSAGNKTCTLISARAGCAKTDTGVRLATKHNKKRWKFIVFGKKNAEEFSLKLPKNATGSTAHSFCNQFIKRKYKLDKSGFKMWKIISKHEDYDYKKKTLSKEEVFVARENLNLMKELVGLLKSNFVNPSSQDVLWLMDHYGISFNLSPEQVSDDAIEFLNKSDNDLDELDYNDMVRIPIISKSVKVSWDDFFLDECQDNTPIRNEMLVQVKNQGCSVWMVGDEFQSIMGFAGADCNSMNNIITAVNPKILPLTINFRCGQKIIEEAQKLVPDIRAWDKSPDGNVSISSLEECLKNLKPGDCALSRYNRVIIPICFKLIKSGQKATIQGRDFGKMLKSLVEGFKATSIDEFYESIDLWKERQLSKNKAQSVSDAVEDKFECLKYFADNSDTVEKIAETIDNIFDDEKGDGIKLSTAHRSKGLEWDNVYILENSTFMSSHPKDKDWNIQQLRNLYYVAITRAKKSLTYVN